MHLLQTQDKGLDRQVLSPGQTWSHPHHSPVLYTKGDRVLKKKE